MQKPVVEVGTTIAATPSQVWQAMQHGAMFPGTEIETDWKIGHPITFTGEWNGEKFVDRGEIQTIAAEEELSFTHWSDKDGSNKRPPSYHVVKYRLEPKGDGTEVTLSQYKGGKQVEVDAGTRAEFEKNWTKMLAGLKQSAEKH
ncbi:MAG: SRPBCC domain-containing protein [Rubrivivax sp.]